MTYRDRKVLERKARLEAGYPNDGLTLGQRLQQLRVAKRWSQARLGQEIRPRMSGNFISDVERGKTSPKIETVRAISVALGVDELYLTFGYEPDELQAPGIKDLIAKVAEAQVPVQPVAMPFDDIFKPEVNEDLKPQVEVRTEDLEPTFRVKVERNGSGVILSVYLD